MLPPRQEDVSDELGWQEVRNRRRPQRNALPPSPRREGADRDMAFRRRVRGRCFRCLAPEHRVAGCLGRVRCLSCNVSGHRERDCWRHQQAGEAPLCSESPAAGPHRPLDRSWATVAAGLPASHEDRSPTVRALPTANSESAGSTAPPEATLRSILEEQTTLLRVELQGLVSPQLEEVVHPLRSVMESVQGLLERVGSLLERAESALEKFPLASTMVQTSPVSPPLAKINLGVADGGALELFGCFSPRNATGSEPMLAWTATPLVASESASPVVQDMPIQQGFAVVSVVPPALEELKESDVPSSKEKITKEIVQIDAIEPQEKVSTSLVGDFFDELACFASGSRTGMQLGEASSSHIGRRSIRLDKKNKGSDIPTAKRAEYRRAEAFGELPNIKSKGKATDEVLNEKMQFYLQMYDKQHTPQTREAIRALVEANA